MSGMELPLILGAGGALVGSQVDKKNPLRGALLGGAAGGLGGAAFAPAATTASTAATTASTVGAMEGAAAASTATNTASPFMVNAYQTLVPGLTSTAPGSQAAMLAEMTGEGMAGLFHTAGAASQPGSIGSGVFRALTNTGSAVSPTQAMALNRAMGGFEQPQVGTQTQTGAFRPGQQINLADPIASLLAPKRKKERPMISLL